MYVHANNIETKITNNYHNCENALINYRDNYYLPMRIQMESIDFSQDRAQFDTAANILNNYWEVLRQFVNEYDIKAQSKFESSFLEEISCYLFHGLNEISNGQLSFYNKGIYAGLKINEDYSIEVMKKDVDFCIGKSINISIDNQAAIPLIIPAVSVEVKKYLDATMFGEIKSSSKTIKSSTPNSRAYVLMGYKDLANKHILAARQDSTLDEMFVLQECEGAPIDSNTLFEYYNVIRDAVASFTTPPEVNVPGRLLINPDN